MTHRSENSRRLSLDTIKVDSIDELSSLTYAEPATYLFYLPFGRTQYDSMGSSEDLDLLAKACAKLDEQSTVCVLTTPEDAALLLSHVDASLKFHHWVAVKTVPDAYPEGKGEIPRRHAALLIFTRYNKGLRRAVTRIQYTYCPACKMTTKDYGGKKHMHHEYGTAISDVWRDIEWDPLEGAEIVADRLRDLFGIEPYRALRLVDLRGCASLQPARPTETVGRADEHAAATRRPRSRVRSRLRHGDCLEVLRTIPSDSVDFCFADLPYNLNKKYCLSKDDLETAEYFQWCNQWLAELYRVLKPGGTLAILNIPLWAARHFKFLSSMMTFRSWIAWDALSRPARKIMPAHYGILCFSKGDPPPLPGLTDPDETEALSIIPQDQMFCVRPGCVSRRLRLGIDDRAALTDIWHDVHRLKHNSRRVNHPCQLPPLLMRRLFYLFTDKGDIILDCFNGAATSTLVAAQMGRLYIGIEKSKRYHNLALKRHRDLRRGMDPFGTGKQTPKSKNSPVRRLPGRKSYRVFKKDLQIEVKRISEVLGRLPTYDEVVAHSSHPAEYFKEYFVGWGEACAAARTTGMSDRPRPQ